MVVLFILVSFGFSNMGYMFSLPKRWWVFVYVVFYFSLLCGADANNFTILESNVIIYGKGPIATTDENFICATLDWYPPEKCDFGFCSWGNASVLNMDLKNVIFKNSIKAFSPLVIRIGGSLQDRIIYQTEGQTRPCVPPVMNVSALIQFNEGCLPLARWDLLNSFFNETRASVVFGLNALRGKVILKDRTAVGPWDFTNAASLIRYTVKKGYKIYGWELGNELNGKGMWVGIDVDTYANDTKALYNLVQDIYKRTDPKPKILAPGGFFEQDWFTKYIIKASGSLDIITQHIYNIGKGDDLNLVERILDPSVLDAGVGVFRSLQDVVKTTGKSVAPWVGESGGIMISGRNGVSNRFLFSFWYLDHMGMASAYGSKKYCRQSLIGGNYGLLNTNTYAPNPDYYSALLWHRLMGPKVLSTNFHGTRKLRTYAHCAKNSKGVILLLINIGDTIVRVNAGFNVKLLQYFKSEVSQLINGPHFSGLREEYHLTPLEGDIRSDTVLLNGKALTVDSSGAIPTLRPIFVDSSIGIKVAPYSIAFVHMPFANLPACG